MNKIPKTDEEKENLLKQYQEDAEEIIQKMLQVLMRAQRKVDDAAYRKALEKIEAKNNN